MALAVFRCSAGSVELPSTDLVLVDREDGGNLIVNPARPVWERGELAADELRQWACLVAATGSAMLASLPQLENGCINYWEAGNWALNDEADPAGRKTARAHRKVHLHLLGRSPQARSPSMRWGEAPFFPSYAERKQWAAKHRRLSPNEVADVVPTILQILLQKYGFARTEFAPALYCALCSYAFAPEVPTAEPLCPECSP